MKSLIILSLLLLPTLALADEPTVTLTKAELTQLLQAENAKAVATYMANEINEKTKDIYAKITKALTPPPPPPAPAPTNAK